jgi:hypothetical protein
LFQVFYTLACFGRLGIKHNDLHLKNILYVAQPEEVSLWYAIPQKNSVELTYVHISTKYVIKVFDMDMGADADPCILHNTSLDNLLNQTDNFNKSDTVAFLVTLFTNMRKIEYTPWEKCKNNFIQPSMQDIWKNWCEERERTNEPIWAHYAHNVLIHTFPNGANLVKGFKTPLEYMHVLLDKFLPRKANSTTLPDFRPYCLPLQHTLVSGTMSKMQLNSEEYAGIHANKQYQLNPTYITKYAFENNSTERRSRVFGENTFPVGKRIS